VEDRISTDSVSALYAAEHDLAVHRVTYMVANREDAEDLVSRAFTRLWRGTNSEDLAALNSIIEGLVKNYWRDQDRRFEDAYGLVPDLAELEQAELVRGRDLTYPVLAFRESFDFAVRGLDAPERDAFILTDLRGLSEREAGSVLAVPQSSVHRRASSARASIAKEIAS
jgi:RNA polymerase sigma factor (sigma-70 family)